MFRTLWNWRTRPPSDLLCRRPQKSIHPQKPKAVGHQDNLVPELPNSAPQEVVHTDNDPKSSRGGCSPVCIGPASTPKQACLLTDLRTELSGQPNPKSPVHKLPCEGPAICQSSPCSNRSLAWGPRGQCPGPHGRPGSPTAWILRPAPARCSHSPLQLRLGARPLDSRRAATLRGRHAGS